MSAEVEGGELGAVNSVNAVNAACFFAADTGNGNMA